MQKIPVMGCGDGIIRAHNGAIAQYPPLNLTAARTLTRFDTGKMITNRGATGTVVVTLPAPVAGIYFIFLTSAAFTFTLQPTTGVSIGAGAATAPISNAVAGSNCLLFSDGIGWHASPGAGAWA